MYQLNGICTPKVDQNYVESLTRRESEVMEQLRTGITVREIAVVMGVSINTTKHHMRNIYAKLGVSTRSEALMFHQRGLGPMNASHAMGDATS